MTMRTFLPSLLLLPLAAACAAQTAPVESAAVPPAPGPGPMQAEAQQASAAIEDAARACAAGRAGDLTERLERYPKVSRPMAPDLSEGELSEPLARLCAGRGTGSLAEVHTMVEEVAVQPGSALATVTMHGRIRGAGRDEHFTVRGLVFLLHGPSGWRILRAAYWPHDIPPVS